MKFSLNSKVTPNATVTLLVVDLFQSCLEYPVSCEILTSSDYLLLPRILFAEIISCRPVIIWCGANSTLFSTNDFVNYIPFCCDLSMHNLWHFSLKLTSIIHKVISIFEPSHKRWLSGTRKSRGFHNFLSKPRTF